MNKLLFLAFFSVAFFTLTYGEVEIGENALTESELSQLRTVREADPKNGDAKKNEGKKKNNRRKKKGKNNQKLNKKKSKKTNKSERKVKKKTNKNGKRSRKAKKGDKKKKALKKNKRKNSKKSTKKSVKNKKKGRKNKKSAKKGRKNSAKKNKKKTKGRNNRKAAKKDRKTAKNKKKGGNRKKTSRKAKKKSNKNAKKSAKKSRKNKEKRNKKKKTSKKNNKKKTNKSTKNDNKEKKASRKIKKTERKTIAGRQSESCGTSQACISSATTYYGHLQKRVRFFNQQKERIKTFTKQSNGKLKKKAVFADLVNRLREASGGNSSNVTCNGEVNMGSKNIEELQTELGACSENIATACMELEEGPKKNQTVIDECAAKVKIFTDLTDKASAAKGSAACALWEADDIAAASADIKDCTQAVVTMNKEAITARKACTNAFSACRKKEDAVSAAISACSPANTRDKIKADLIQGKSNKAAAETLAEKVSMLSSGGSSTGSGSTVTCQEFITKANEAIKQIMNAPLESSTETMITDVTSFMISPECSADEKTSLMTSSEDLVKAIQEIDDTAAVKQEDTKTATGEEIPESELIVTTKDAGETTKAVETTPAGETTKAEETTMDVQTTLGQTMGLGATAPQKKMQLKKLLQLQKQQMKKQMKLQKQQVL